MSDYKPMTFSDVLSRERTRRTSVPSQDSFGRAPLFSLDYLDQLMTQLIDLLANDSVKSLKDKESSLSDIPAIYTKAVSTWHDENDLNVIHYSIIYNKPTCLDFFLSKTAFFPPDTEPIICPYAHLAAFFGHAECLRIILTLRPKDFFKARLPKHAIKLPNAIMRRFKVAEQRSSRLSKNIRALLNKIPSEEAENENGNPLDEANQAVKGLENDVFGLEKIFRKDTSRPQALPGGKTGSFQGRKSLLNPDTGKTSAGQGRKSLVNTSDFQKTTKSRSTTSVKFDTKNSFDTAVPRKRSKKDSIDSKKKKDKITVHRDIFSEYPDEELDKRSSQSDELYAPGIDSTPSEAPTCEMKMRKSLASRTSFCPPNAVPSNVKSLEPLQLGVRKIKPLKQFHLKIQPKVVKEKDNRQNYMNKTPLTFAAEKGHIECIELMLDLVVSKRLESNSSKTEPLTMATKARSPEALVVLLNTKKYCMEDYNGAVLTAIRGLFPDCLAVLLNTRDPNRSQTLFQGSNLFHILFSQSLLTDFRYEMLPTMTTTLISCKESVNSQSCPRTYPLYTLIQCAFNVGIGKKMTYYLGCLEVLLAASANPHYNEIKNESTARNNQTMVQRSGYTSALNCVFENASQAALRDVKMYWLKLLLKKIIITIVFKDKTRRRVLDDILFLYMDHVCDLGIDRIILKSLLRYGGNPDARLNGNYAINVFFNKLLPYLTRFQVINCYEQYQAELETLMILCRRMSPACLKGSFEIFKDTHFMKTPLQGLPVARYFCYLVNDLLHSPQSLKDLVSNYLWKHLNRNEKVVSQLPVRGEVRNLILP